MEDGTALLKYHTEAMFTADKAGALLAVNEPWGGGGIAPLLFRGKAQDGGSLLFLRAGLAEPMARRARALHRAGETETEAYKAALEGKAWAEARCFALPARGQAATPGCLALTRENHRQVVLGEFGWLAEELAAAGPGWPCRVYAPAGQVLAVCRSVRVGKGHEAGIETAQAFRGRGYALKVLWAWAAAVWAQGGVPLYSARRDNAASLRVAEKAGLEWYADTLSVW